MAEIIRLAARGEGVTADGHFVPLTAPGDAVDAAGAIASRGAHYTAPVCRHYPKCGGCQLQHVDDAAYMGYLMERVCAALAAQGIADVNILPPTLSPPHTRRRASLKAEKRGKEVRLGFNEAGSHALVDVRECAVLHPDLVALLQPLRRLLGVMMGGRGAAQVALTMVDQGVDVALSGVTVEGVAATEALADFAAQHGLARLALDEGDGFLSRWEPEAATMTFNGVAVGFPHGAFLQATADGEAALVRAVQAAVGPATTVADLFAGLGTFALPLSARAKVHGVEGARDPVLALTVAARRGGRPITTEHRDLFRRPLMAAELARFEAVVLDPPRAGAKEQVVALAASAVPCIAYVSCNPATFARDAAALVAGGYALQWVQPVGQFRWSTHVELVAQFTR